MKKIILSILCCWISVLTYAETENYVIDPVHSSITFKIRHFLSKVTGTFDKFEGVIAVNRENMETNTTQATIEAASINTRNEKRDHHLQSPDFFDVEKYSKITFQSKSWKKIGEDQYEVTGDFTMKGVTKEIFLNVKSTGFGKGMENMDLSGWEAETVIKKSDFGITYGGSALGDEVEIAIEVEAHKEA
ncbi:MAG: YceI family protein [Chlamydiae bacterium]|nr:YceI family protein [Chlamydiota bacterium]